MKKFEKSGYDKGVIPCLCLIIGSFLIYIPVISRYFVSDDFDVLFRVCLQKVFFIRGFFRPLSDLSILLNYQIDGFNPYVFNSFNILVHGINSYLVFIICLHFGKLPDGKNGIQFAIIGSIAFLCYPFHNEGVVWLLGRGASMACLFSLLSIICFYKIENIHWRTGLASLCYFLSISAFESTIFLPLLFILLAIFEKKNPRFIIKWTASMTAILLFHLSLRFLFAGSVWGSYGKDFFLSDTKIYLLNVGKVMGRLLLPPIQNSALFTLLFVLLITAIVFVIAVKYKKDTEDDFARTIFYLCIMLAVSCIIPVVTGISTKTSETDRILYFPSVFICIICGRCVAYGIKSIKKKATLCFLLLCFCLFFLEKNNLNWRKASDITRSVKEKIDTGIQNKKLSGKLYFLNLPDEIGGAYVFRKGFSSLVRILGADSSNYISINNVFLNNGSAKSSNAGGLTEKSSVALPSGLMISQNPEGCWQLFDHRKMIFICQPGDSMGVWKVKNIDYIQGCTSRSSLSLDSQTIDR